MVKSSVWTIRHGGILHRSTTPLPLHLPHFPNPPNEQQFLKMRERFQRNIRPTSSTIATTEELGSSAVVAIVDEVGPSPQAVE